MDLKSVWISSFLNNYRIFSEYKYSNDEYRRKMSVNHFHTMVEQQIQDWNDCIAKYYSSYRCYLDVPENRLGVSFR